MANEPHEPGTSETVQADVSAGTISAARAAAEAVMRELIPHEIAFGQYRIVCKISRGGFGTVYEAVDTKAVRGIAIKVIDIRNPEWREMALREIALLGQFDHPHIVKLYSYNDRTPGCIALILELVRGYSLDDHLRMARLAIGDALAMGLQLAETLAAIHTRGIAHGDIHSGNVIVLKDRSIKLIDFGLGRLENPEAIMDIGLVPPDVQAVLRSRALGGVSGCAAPEIFGPAGVGSDPASRASSPPARVDLRADIYSFGALLYRMLCGKRPFPKSDGPWSEARSELEAIDPPPRLIKLLEGCLAELPETRIQSMAIVVDRLRRLQLRPAPRRARRVSEGGISRQA